MGALCLLMVTAGAGGYWTFVEGGFPFRLASLEQQYSIFRFDESSGSTGACKAQFPEQDQCLEAIAGAPHDAVVVGDSHAYHYFMAVSPYLKGLGKNALLMGGGGCVPFYDLESWQEGFADYCEKKINAALDYASREPSVKTVLLASRGPVYITGKGFGSVEASYDRRLRLTTHPEMTDLAEIYAQAMRETLGRLIKAGKQVIVLVEVPEMGFDPIVCAPSRMFFKQGRPASGFCAIPRREYDERASRYLQIVRAVVKEYPLVYAFYPYPYLCDERYCWAMKDGHILYRNDNHLAPDGWKLLEKAFADEMERAQRHF
jgi:SGNH domain (fused to AT3 domains)